MGDTGRTKAEAVADVINGTLYELVLRCIKRPEEPPQPYFAVAVLGYGTDAAGASRVGSLLRQSESDLWWTPDLASNPLRVDRRPGPGGLIEVLSPVWIEPGSSGGTPMCSALDRAGALAHAWVQSYPTAFPPVVINLSDGEATDGDPRVWASRLRSLRTDDGGVLLFNLALSSTAGTTVLFPSSPPRVDDRLASTLFEMSSLLPETMLEAAGTTGTPVTAGARGFGFNADFRGIVTFLNVGTAVGHLVR